MTLERTREYELVMILSPEATEAEARETVSWINAIISEGSGSIAQQDNWGVRRLAYPIQRFVEGNYFFTRCSMEAQAAVELNETLNSSQDVLRHLVFRLDNSELRAMEKQAERELAARRETERRERVAREREEARRIADAQAAAAAQRAAESAESAESAASPQDQQSEQSEEPSATPAPEPVSNPS